MAPHQRPGTDQEAGVSAPDDPRPLRYATPWGNSTRRLQIERKRRRKLEKREQRRAERRAEQTNDERRPDGRPDQQPHRGS
jgi:hypothetical protein